MEFTAPGKILLLGGYSVLDGYPALSIAVEDKKGKGVTASCSEGDFRIISEQFGIDRAVDPDDPADRDSAGSAFGTALAYLKGKGTGLKPVTVRTNNSRIFGKRGEKSGLGSSAASIVAIVAAVLGWHGINDRETIHKVSQIANFLATEKTGAGFDVACSVFGTIRYRRFERSAISLDENDEGFAQEIVGLVRLPWPGLEVKPFSLGRYGLLAFNIRGSKTATLDAIKAMERFRKKEPERYEKDIRAQAEAEEKVFKGIKKGDGRMVRDGMRKAREAQRRLSSKVEDMGAFDPIEPEELRMIIEKAEGTEGVVAGRCPGAGGYDSLAFLVEKDDPGIAKRIVELGKETGVKLEKIDFRLSEKGVRRVSSPEDSPSSR